MDPFDLADHSVYVWLRVLVGVLVAGAGVGVMVSIGRSAEHAAGLQRLERSAGIALPQDETRDWIVGELRAGSRRTGVAFAVVGALIVIQSTVWRLPVATWIAVSLGEAELCVVVAAVIGVARLVPGGAEGRRSLVDFQPPWVLSVLTVIALSGGALVVLILTEPFGHPIRESTDGLWWADAGFTAGSGAALLGFAATAALLRRGAPLGSEHRAVWRDMLLAGVVGQLQWPATFLGVYGVVRLSADLVLRSPGLEDAVEIVLLAPLAFAVVGVVVGIVWAAQRDQRSPAARRVMRRHWPAIDAVARHPLGVDGLAPRSAASRMPGPPPGETIAGPPKG